MTFYVNFTKDSLSTFNEILVIAGQLHDKYVGCFIDTRNSQSQKHVLTDRNDLTIEICIQKCYNLTQSEMTFAALTVSNFFSNFWSLLSTPLFLTLLPSLFFILTYLTYTFTYTLPLLIGILTMAARGCQFTRTQSEKCSNCFFFQLNTQENQLSLEHNFT